MRIVHFLVSFTLGLGAIWLQAQQFSRRDLQPIPQPDVETLEEAVREQIATAQALLDEALETPELSAADLSDLYGQLGRVFQLYEFYGAAEACYRNARFLAPGNYRWHHYLGIIYQERGQATAAELSFEMALALEPSNSAARILRGKLRLDQDLLDLAEQDFRSALELDSSSPAAHQSLGRLLLKRENFKEALEHFQTALGIVPEANSLHYLIAQAYRGLGDLESARSHLEQRGEVGVAVDDPLMEYLRGLIQGEVVYLLRGRQAFSSGDFEGAAKEFQKALEASPESVRARVNLASALSQLGRSAEARKLLEEVLEKEPGHNTAHFNLGSLAYSQGDYATAAEELAIYRDSFPNDVQATALQGLSLVELNRPEEALPLLQAVHQALPDNERVRLALVDLLLSFSEFEEALKILREGNRQFPSDGLTALALARLLAAAPATDLRDGQEAYRLSLKVYQAQPRPLHAATVAMALAEMGRCESAVRWQRTALSLAEQESSPSQLIDQLRSNLVFYQNSRPCRPGVPE